MGGRDEEKIAKQYKDIKKDWGKDRYLDYLKIKCFKGQTDYDFREKVQDQIELVYKNIENASSSDKTWHDWIEWQFKILLGIDGVGFPTASVILHFLDSKHFAMIDKNAFNAYQDEIGGKEELSNKIGTTVEQYIQYNQYIHEEAKRKDRTFRDVEFELFKKGRRDC